MTGRASDFSIQVRILRAEGTRRQRRFSLLRLTNSLWSDTALRRFSSRTVSTPADSSSSACCVPIELMRMRSARLASLSRWSVEMATSPASRDRFSGVRHSNRRDFVSAMPCSRKRAPSTGPTPESCSIGTVFII